MIIDSFFVSRGARIEVLFEITSRVPDVVVEKLGHVVEFLLYVSVMTRSAREFPEEKRLAVVPAP